ncbi:MAG: hypothetical protein IT282_02460 [Bacteroidetes bacterium]|nr:hypothetical protein [Bacteroidota bacterium]
MRWKYWLPVTGAQRDERTALEDLYLLPEDGSSGGQSYWITLEGLLSFTGGTREEKLERLGGSEYVISDTLDMLVRKDDFNREEVLAWAKVFINVRFGDPNPVLIEATGDEISRCTPVISDAQRQPSPTEKVRLLFVQHKAGAADGAVEELLGSPDRLDIRTAWLEDLSDDDERLRWADLIVVPEKRMRHMMHKKLKNSGMVKRLVCLFLPEHHGRQDPTYAALFKERVFVYLERLGWKVM